MIGPNLPCSCLQCLTGDQEQTKASTGGEKLQEALVDQLAHKAIGFLGGSKPHLPSSMLFSLFKALRDAQVSNLPADRDSLFDILQYLCDLPSQWSCAFEQCTPVGCLNSCLPGSPSLPQQLE